MPKFYKSKSYQERSRKPTKWKTSTRSTMEKWRRKSLLWDKSSKLL